MPATKRYMVEVTYRVPVTANNPVDAAFIAGKAFEQGGPQSFTGMASKDEPWGYVTAEPETVQVNVKEK